MHQLIQPDAYIKTAENVASLQLLRDLFAKNIRPDGVRNRAYLKLIWQRATNNVSVAQNQSYFQSATSNVMDGGKTRQFAVMDKSVLSLSIMQNVIHHNLSLIKSFGPLIRYRELILGLHFIQYKVDQYGASYSSPDDLHIDDEPLVFVHLLNLSANAWGGDNIIADLQSKKITHVVRLEKPLETLILTRDYYHAVTALGSRVGEAQRDILLFTVEPPHTQLAAVS